MPACPGHERGYTHFQPVEELWDVGVKLIVMQPFTPQEDPEAPAPHPPPYLVASFSFRTPQGERRYLPFALPAEAWAGEEPSQADFDVLIARALPRLRALLVQLRELGSFPEPEHPLWV